MREIKFRAWDHNKRQMFYFGFPDYYEGMNDVTWQQFTGLHDKNSKEIYEGDIYIIHDEDKPLPKVVKWHGANMGGYGMAYKKEFYEVIGNIYENPELLKEAA